MLSLLNMMIESAVILLHEQSSDSLVLTQRTEHLRDHPGEICFPGGRFEHGDADFWATALRELREELGVDKERLVLIKRLKSEQTLRGMIIHPWLATIQTLDPYLPNPHEVADVLRLPMVGVKTLNNYKDINVERSGRVIKTCQYAASHYFIWGATARIMKQLCL